MRVAYRRRIMTTVIWKLINDMTSLVPTAAEDAANPHYQNAAQLTWRQGLSQASPCRQSEMPELNTP